MLRRCFARRGWVLFNLPGIRVAANMSEPRLVALQAQRSAPPKRVFRRGRRVCRFCKAELNAITRGRGACDAPDCRKRDRRERDSLRRERDEIELIAMRAAVARAIETERLMMLDLRAAAAPGMAKVEPVESALAVDQIATTNHISTPLVDVDPDDVEQFETRLLAMLRKEFKIVDEGHPNGDPVLLEDDGTSIDDEGVLLSDLVFRTFEEREALEKPASPAENAACAACRGLCCQAGFSNLAYFRPADVARYRLRNPGATPESMTAALMAYAPDTRVENSCLFHGEFGCTLPREMRSTMCNGYKCGWIQKINEMEKDGRPPRLVAGLEDDRPKRAFFVDASGGLNEVPINSSVNSAHLMAEAAEAARNGLARQADNDQASLSEDSSSGLTGSSRGGTGS